MARTIDYKTMGEKIHHARKNKKLSQEQLAEICSLSAAHIGHIERGSRIPSLETVFRISQALDVSLDYIVLNSLENNCSSSASLKSIIQKMSPEKQAIIISAVKALCEYDLNCNSQSTFIFSLYLYSTSAYRTSVCPTEFIFQKFSIQRQQKDSRHDDK